MSLIRNILLLPVITAILCSSCKKSDSHASDAVITGYDNRKCACCGGLMINFDNDPKPYNAPFYLVRQIPGNAGISEQTNFPLYVRIIWRPASGGCSNNSIDILGIKRK